MILYDEQINQVSYPVHKNEKQTIYNDFVKKKNREKCLKRLRAQVDSTY